MVGRCRVRADGVLRGLMVGTTGGVRVQSQGKLQALTLQWHASGCWEGEGRRMRRAGKMQKYGVALKRGAKTFNIMDRETQ